MAKSEERFFEITVAKVTGNTELQVGQKVSVSVSRTQAMWNVKTGVNAGTCKMYMNTPDEVFYAKETRKDILGQIGEKSDEFGLDTKDDE